MTAHIPSRSEPVLRFPEFRGEPGWAYMQLRSVLEEHGLKSDGLSEVHSVSLSAGIVPQIEHMGRSFAASDTTRYTLVRPFDIVYTRSPLAVHKLGIVKQHKGPDNAIVSPLYGVFTPKNPHLGRLIEAYFESSSRSLQFLDPLAQKGAKNTIQLSNDRFLSGSLFIPENEHEQRKLAEFLRSFDDLIAAGGRMLKALRDQKQGLVQLLFPSSGETAPRLRFPEFRDASPWTKGHCRDVATVLPGYGFPERFQGGKNGKYPFYKVSDISRTVETGRKYISESRNYIDADVLDAIRAKAVPAGTVIFAKIGEAIRSNRRVITTGPAVIDNNTAGLQAKTDKLSGEFLFYLWSNVSLIEHSGGVVPAVSKSALEDVPLCYPSDLAEQQRIADCLASLDALTSAQVARLDKLKTYKQGLLQQIFPSVEDESL